MCDHILTKGRKKGEKCGDKVVNNTNFCRYHVNSNHPEVFQCASNKCDGTQCPNLTTSKTKHCKTHKQSSTRTRKQNEKLKLTTEEEIPVIPIKIEEIPIKIEEIKIEEIVLSKKKTINKKLKTILEESIPEEKIDFVTPAGTLQFLAAI